MRLLVCGALFSFILAAAAVGLNAQEKAAAAPQQVVHPNGEEIEQPRFLKKNELFSQGHTADVLDIQQVWAAYAFYNDSGNGEGVASLFTENGVLQHLWNNKGKWVPHGGVGSTQTPYGVKGGGCVLRGRRELAHYFGGERAASPWPGWGHHTTPNVLVKVNDDGKTAVLSAPYVIASTSEKGESRISTGGYRVFFRKTSAGWLIAEQYNVADRPRGGNRCDDGGNLPRLPK